MGLAVGSIPLRLTSFKSCIPTDWNFEPLWSIERAASPTPSAIVSIAMTLDDNPIGQSRSNNAGVVLKGVELPLPRASTGGCWRSESAKTDCGGKGLPLSWNDATPQVSPIRTRYRLL